MIQSFLEVDPFPADSYSHNFVLRMCATIEEHGLQDGNKFIDPKLLLPKKTWEMYVSLDVVGHYIVILSC